MRTKEKYFPAQLFASIFICFFSILLLSPSSVKAEVYYCCCGTSLLGYSDNGGNCYAYSCSGKMITTSSDAGCGSSSNSSGNTNAQFVPQIGIPGSDFQTGKAFNVSNNTATIANYVKAIYKYLIGIIGIVACIMLMVGGIVWLTAGGSPEKVKQAQEYIIASLTGLVLALGSFMILGTINPALVNFTISNIKSVNPYSDTSSPASGVITGCCDGKCQLASDIINCASEGGNWIEGNYSCSSSGKCQGSATPAAGCCDIKNGTSCQGATDQKTCEVYCGPAPWECKFNSSLRCVGGKCVSQ